MPIGENVSLGDKLIKKTTNNKNIANITNKTRIASNGNKTNNVSNASKTGRPSTNPKTDTYKTKKMTFYVKEDLVEKLYSFAYWNRQSLTEAFNVAFADGLKGKNTKPRR